MTIVGNLGFFCGTGRFFGFEGAGAHIQIRHRVDASDVPGKRWCIWPCIQRTSICGQLHPNDFIQGSMMGQSASIRMAGQLRQDSPDSSG